jgi:hypothetical protein
MRRLRMSAFVAAFVLFTVPVGARVAGADDPAIPTPSDEAEATYAKPRGLMAASAIAKLEAGGLALAPKTVTKPTKHLQKAATTWAKTTWPALADGDIMAIAFIVLMEAAKSAREDLKAIMDSVKAINDAKQEYREMIAKLQAEIAARGGTPKASKKKKKPPLPEPLKTPLGLEYHPSPRVPQLRSLESMTLADLEAKLAELTDAKDSLAELGEEQQLRMRIYMDRRQKLMSTISNLRKKMSETSAAIVSNLK